MTPTLLGLLPDSTITLVSWSSRVLVLVCVVPYCWATIRYPMNDPRRVHPRPGTWGVWFIVGSVTAAAQALGGAPDSAWGLKAALSIGPAVVAVVALARHEPLLLNRVDRWSMALCAVGIAIYLTLYFGWLGTADAVAAGAVVVVMHMTVDTIAAFPTWYDALHRHAPMIEIVTFALALVSVLAVLCILPVPWTFLAAAIFVFLAVQMISIIVTLQLGRARNPVVPPFAEHTAA